MSVGSVFVEIIPRVMGMSAAMTRDVVAPAEQGGTEAGRTFSTAFTRSVTSGTSATTAAVQSQVRAAQAAVEQSSVAISAARDKELAAADRVTIAETKLAETRARNAAGSSQVVAAEARLEAAKRGEVTASERLVLAESNEGRAKTELIARNDALAASNARAGASSAAGSSKALGLVGSLSKLGTTTAVAAAIMGGDALHQAGNYQQSLTKLATTAGESTGNLKLVGDGMLNMAGQVGVSAQDLSKAMYVVESSGIHGADSLVVLKAAAQGAKQENADLGHVTDAVTTALHDYNLPASDAAKVTSQLVTAVSHGKTTFDDLTGAMHSVTPVAAAAGISLAEASGTLASMTASGMSADQAAQNLGATIKGLSAPTQPVIKEMAALGLNSVELSKNLGQKGVAGTLQEVSEAIMQHMGPAGTTLMNTMNQSKLAGADADKMYQSMPPALKKVADELKSGAITTRQFTTGTGHLDAALQGQGKSWLMQYKNATGFSQALKSGGNDTQTYMEALKRATGTTDGMAVALQVTGEHAGATNEAIRDIAAAAPEAGGNIKGWSEVQGNFNQKLSEVVAGIRSWVIELGQKLLPAATELLKFLMDAGHWLGEHSRLIGEVAKWVGIAVGAFVAWRAAMIAGQAITVAWGVVMGVFNGTITAGTVATKLAAAGQWLWNVALDANPVGIVIVAIGALVAGVIYAYTHFEGFRNVVNDVWEAMKLAFRWVETAGVNTWHALVAAFNWTKDAFNSVKDAGVSLWHELQSAWTSLLSVTHEVVNGIVSAWHSFTDVVSTAWNSVIKPVFEFIGNAFELVGKIIAAVVGTVILVQFRLFMSTVHALWDDAVHPVLNLIGDLFHWLYDSVIMPVIGFINDAVTAWANIMHWLHDNAIKPVLEAIGAAWHWVYDVAVKVVTDLINDAIRGWATTITWLHDNVIKPVFGFISDAWHWLYDTSVKVVTDLINAALAGWGAATHFLHEQVIKPVFDGISTSFHWLYDSVVLPVIDLIKAMITDLQNALHFLYDNVVKPVFDAIGAVIKGSYDDVIKPAFEALKTGVHDVGSTFDTVVTAIGVIWDKMKALVATPINFVIDTVLNNGLFKAWDDVAGLVGLPKAPHMDLVKFADGGVMPGYTPGQDVHQFVSPTGGRLELSGGEAIMRPEWTRAMGGPGAVAEMNRAARTGTLSAVANGGAVDTYNANVRAEAQGDRSDTGLWRTMQEEVSKLFPQAAYGLAYRPEGNTPYHITGRGIDIVPTGADLTGGLLSGFSSEQEQQAARDNPRLQAGLHEINQGLVSKFGTSKIAEMIYTPGINIMEGQPWTWDAGTQKGHYNHVHLGMDNAEALGGRAPGTVIGSSTAGVFGGTTWPALFAKVRGQFPWAIDTSDVRPGDTGYHGKGQAVDIGAPGNSQGMLDEVGAWAVQNMGGINEIIHNPNASVKDGKNVPASFWGAQTWAEHANHVHLASSGLGLSGSAVGDAGVLGNAAGAVTHFLRDQVGNLFDLAMKPVSAAIGSFGSPPPAIKGLPKALFDKTEHSVRDFIVGKADAKDSAGGGAPGGNYTGPIPGGDAVQRWRGLVDSTLTELGMPTSLDDKVLRQIATESGGNPNATQGAIGDVNNASGDLARGLMQVIGTTFRGNAGPYVGLGQYDPHASIYAGLNYARGRYGPDLSFLGQGHGYDEGGWMKPGDVGANFSTKPEPVFSSSQWEVLRANLNTGGGGGKDVTINVHSQPGQSGEQIALEVKRQLLFEMR